jgi:hypothetical protein
MAEPSSEQRELQPIRIELHNSSPQPESHSAFEWVKTIGDIAKAVAWPVAVLALAIWLREPLRATAELLPQKILAANKVSVFSFSFEVQRKAELRAVSAQSIRYVKGRCGCTEVHGRLSDRAPSRVQLPLRMPTPRL